MKFLVIIALLIVFAPGNTTYYLVRHAEKACDDCTVCGLSAEGIARAEVLSDYLSERGIDTILASQCLRTQHTARPLAERLQKTVGVYQTGQLTSMINTLKSFNDARQILIVGHSNQIPVIIDSLSHQQVTIAEDDYDNLFIIKKRQFFRTTVSLKKLTYGEMSP